MASGVVSSSRPGARRFAALRRRRERRAPTCLLTSGKATTSAPGPRVADRLNQGPFGIEQDEGWYTILTTTASSAPVRNFGLGLVGYTWEENGPALAVREGKQTLEAAIERLAGLSFVDVLYIRCDWRDVQSRPAGSTSPRCGRSPWTRPSATACASPSGSSSRTPRRSPRGSPCPTSCRRRCRSWRSGGPVAGSPEARRAALRPSGVPARLPRAQRAPGRRARREPARGVHGPDDVRVLGRGAHQRLREPLPRLPHRRANLRGDDARADRSLEARAPGRQHPARHQPHRQPRGPRSGRARRGPGCAPTASSWTSRSRSRPSPTVRPGSRW